MHALKLADTIFLSTLSLRRATNCTSIGRPKRLYFYPRSPCGERRFNPLKAFVILTFLSTLSLRRATNARPETRRHDAISIHALLAESDPAERHASTQQEFLSTLSLRRATNQRMQKDGTQQFLSTLSLRRATIDSSRAASCQQHFYPRSPCGERPKARRASRQQPAGISIHALLAESDG